MERLSIKLAKKYMERSRKPKALAGLLSLLEIIKAAFKNPDKAAKTQILQESSRLQAKNMLITIVYMRV